MPAAALHRVTLTARWLDSEGEDLARVHDVLGVERTLDCAHHLDGCVAGLADQEVDLVQAQRDKLRLVIETAQEVWGQA